MSTLHRDAVVPQPEIQVAGLVVGDPRSGVKVTDVEATPERLSAADPVIGTPAVTVPEPESKDVVGGVAS